MIGNYPEAFYAYDSAQVNVYYRHGQFECPNDCHVCIAAAYHLSANNSCFEEYEADLILIDFETMRGNKIADVEEPTAINDLMLGSNLILTHPDNVVE